MLQYAANFYVTCMRHSPIYAELVKQKKEPTVNRAKKLESNISNGRKIFRLGLWLYEIPMIESLIKDKKMSPYLKFFKIISTFCSFIYYCTDNIIWLANIGYLENRIFGIKWKQIKNQFSLIKTVLELFIAAYTIILKKREESIIREKLREYFSNKVEAGKEWYVLMVNLILLRREIVFHHIEFFIYLARFCMLTSSLKLIGHNLLHPIFVSTCGLF